MAPHSSILAWRISWREEPGGLQVMGSQRVGHDRATKHTPLCLYLCFEFLNDSRVRYHKGGRRDIYFEFLNDSRVRYDEGGRRDTRVKLPFPDRSNKRLRYSEVYTAFYTC